MYKLVCIDMDGTLLNDDKEVSEGNLKTLQAAYEKGVKIVICTGRMFTSANYFADLVGVKVPVIASNGAYIREKDRNEVIYKSVLGIENCRKTLKVLKKYDICPHFNSSEVVFTDRMAQYSQAYIKMNKTLPKNRQIEIKIVNDWEKTFKEQEDEILKCIAIDDDIEKVLLAKQELAEDGNLYVVSSNINNLEVMSKGVNKGRGVEILAAFYGIQKEEIMCIGDNENDLSMLKVAGMAVAMGNSEECVKEIAGFITDTNNNDGVAKAIERFIPVYK